VIWAPPDAGHVVIDLAAGPSATIDPKRTLGAAIDGVERGEVARLFTPHNLARIKAAGLGPISYRLRTELGVEAWHWSEEGAWSDPARRQGYWISSDDPRRPVLTTHGYRLPRRGDTHDQADDQDFSRLDDGDLASVWKSNPYLDPAYAPDAPARPQWVVAEFQGMTRIDSARIAWAAPFARRYEVQYWVGDDEDDAFGRWITFPGGRVTDGAGGLARLALSPTPIATQFVRVLLEDSSHTAAPGARDPRDAMGFAVAEIRLGRTGADGRFIDAVRHGRSTDTQTTMHVSSTDPWHRASDLDPDMEQPGFDRLYASGLTRGLPMMAPVAALYDNPDNAAAEVRFLKRRGYAVRQVELGEEPDGQLVDAEDFATLYLRFAAAVRAVDPTLVIGGPSLQQAVADTWLDPNPDRSWTSRFIAALSARGRLGDLGFFSFERYPVENLCGPVAEKLRDATVAGALDLARLRRDGVPTTIPWIITEFGYSAYEAPAEVQTASALIDADIAAGFLQAGGAAAYLYGVTPGTPMRGIHPCSDPGGQMMFRADDEGRAREPLPTFHAARMLTRDWLGSGGPVALFQANYDLKDGLARPWVTAYAARRADGRWSVLLINRDPRRARAVDIAFHHAPADTPLAGPTLVTQYGAAQFAWRRPTPKGVPSRDLPPRRWRRPASGGPIRLPAFSLTVVTTDN
jgi:hypothetical protein